MDKCFVCGVQPHKYKCPQCRVARYCSSACFKIHREKPCHPSASGGQDIASQSAASSTSSHHQHSTSSSSTSEEDEQNTQLSSEQLESLGSWPDLKPWLDAYPPLRQIIRELDRANSASAASGSTAAAQTAVAQLQRALDADPRLSEFVHTMLLRVGARDPATSSLAPNALSATLSASASAFDPLLHSARSATAAASSAATLATSNTPSVRITSAADWQRVQGAAPMSAAAAAAADSLSGLPAELTGDPLDPAYINQYLAMYALAKSQ